MGAWGSESCSNDTCFDHLGAKDIYEMTQAEANRSLALIFNDGKGIYLADCRLQETQLGVVIWILRHGLKVGPKHLETAKDNAQELLKAEDYLKGWKSPKERVDHLLKELNDIKNASENDGSIQPEHIPGLMEKAAELFENKGENDE